MIDRQRLQNRLAEAGFPLAEKQLLQLDTYARLLCEWNQRINLTAIVEPEDIENKHFFDSISLAFHPLLRGEVLDVGSGAGFPGMVLKIVRPELAVTLMEPTGKRVFFQQALAETLGLTLDLVKERAEEAARKRWRESYDIATARAVAALPVLCEYCLPLVKPGGFFIAMKGDARQELADAENALQKLGGVHRATREYTLPEGSARSLLVFEKVAPTPPQYPRNGGKIAKSPL